MCSAARSARGPALTDDVSTQANGQNPEVLFINGALLISLNGARSLTRLGNTSNSTDMHMGHTECIFLFSYMLK